VVGALLFALLGPSGIALGSHVPAGISRGAEAASSLVLVGTVPSEVVVGAATGLTWEAVDANGSRVASFAAACGLTITVDTNGSNAPSWVNASVSGPLGRAANGTYSIPSTAWRSGELRLFVVVGKAASVTVDLVGSLLPANRAAAGLVILPDLDHLVLYDPEKSTFNITERWDDTFWHVRDPFGDPVPGAVLTARTLSSSGTTDSLVPVVPLANGSSGAWLNYSFPKNSSGSWEVLDAAGAVLLGPVVFSPVAPVSSNASAAAGMIAPISPELLGAIVLVFLGGVGGIVALVSGGSPRAARPRPGPEDELRRLAEGRETVVELLRRKGPLSIEEIEASWEPAPAPAAVADWVASLVTDGTLTATLGEGGKARFTLAARPEAEPRVTLDEDELARGIARRDAAVETDEEGDPSAP
jgi:hypothetical protein